MSIVYVALVDTRYQIMSVATTESEAIRVACAKALVYLTEAGAVSTDTDSVEKIADYFGVGATKLTIGTADFVGNN